MPSSWGSRQASIGASVARAQLTKSRTVAVADFEAQLATLVEAPPVGDEWLHEQKFDGYRIGLCKDGRTVELWSRRGQEWTAEFPLIAMAGGKASCPRR
jgi:bifunctional non-homologous end joining protein LigD